MTFTATHVRAFLGTDITVTVAAGAKECIASVTILFDGDELDQSQLDPGTEKYTRSFPQAGSSIPGMDHTLIVTAIDQNGVTHGATTRWSD